MADTTRLMWWLAEVSGPAFVLCLDPEMTILPCAGVLVKNSARSIEEALYEVGQLIDGPNGQQQS